MNDPIHEIVKLAIANLDQIQDRPSRARILTKAAELIEAKDTKAANQFRATAAFIEDSEKHQLILIERHRQKSE